MYRRQLLLMVLLSILIGLSFAAIHERPALAQSTPLNFGQTASDSIGDPGESKTYTFSADANDTVAIRLHVTSGDLNTGVGLYAPDTSLLASDNSPYYVEIISALPVSGEHRIVVGDLEGDSTGSYDIYIERLNNPSVSSALGFGDMVSGSIDPYPEVDVYTFFADADDTVRACLEVTSGGLSAYVRLYAPDMELVNSGSSPYYVEITAVLPASGEYRITVGDRNIDDTGVYELGLSEPGDANMDGALDGRDVIRCKKITLKLQDETCGADASMDGVVDDGDVMRVKEMILGIEQAGAAP